MGTLREQIKQKRQEIAELRQQQTDQNLSSIRELYEEMKQQQKEIEQHQNKINTIFGEIKHELIDLSATMDKEQKREVARFLYWDVPEISTKQIIDCFSDDQYKSATISGMVGSLTLTKTCSSCGIECKQKIKNRTEQKLKRNQKIFCNLCQKKKEEAAESARIKHRKEGDRLEKEHIRENQVVQRRLNHLKTMPYDEYLETSHWKSIRQKALGRANYRCQLCNKNGKIHIHHRTYKRRGEERPSDVIALCEKCHAKFHDKETG